MGNEYSLDLVGKKSWSQSMHASAEVSKLGALTNMFEVSFLIIVGQL